MMEFLELSSGRFIFVPRSVYVIQWKGRPYHCVGTSITRILYHAARSSSTAICPVSISGIKISAYFSIISARKPAKALHSSKLDVQAEAGKISFSLAGYFFNRQLHFLVAGQRVPAILSNFPSNLSNQFFQPFQFFLCVFLP